MSIFKYTLQISGSTFFDTKSMENELIGDLGVYKLIAPNDILEEYRNGKIQRYSLGFGSGEFHHPKIFSIQHVDKEFQQYEDWFIDLAENNYKIFLKYGVDDFRIMIEAFFDKEEGNCNFEIFSRKGLNRLSDMNFALPISTYALNHDQMIALEVKESWKL